MAFPLQLCSASEVRMFSNEGLFRLFSIGLLGVLFISTSALANKKREKPQNIFSVVKHVEEAEKINNNELHVLNLTSIGERVEIVTPQIEKK